MLTAEEEEFIARHAYVPEHLPGYGRIVSGGEPFLSGDFLFYHAKGFLVFIGYPLEGQFDRPKMERALEETVRRTHPTRVACIASSIFRQDGEREKPDCYYRLDLAREEIRPKVKNMLQRASRELDVNKGCPFREEHHSLISDFLASRNLHEGTRAIFERIPHYASSVPSAVLFEARDRDQRLIGYDIADFGAKSYAFYMFNFRSRKHAVPGASDLLFFALIQAARERGKSFLNLGLGINDGVASFKKKWGGVSFLKYESLLYRPAPPSLFESIRQGVTPT